MLPETLNYCVHLLTQICTFAIFKLFWATVLIIFGYFFDISLQTQLEALLLLLIMDMFSAIFAAYQTGEVIESRKIRRTAVKILVYFSMVSAAFLVEKSVPLYVIDDTLIMYLLLTELISLFENFARAGYTTPKNLINQLKGMRDKK